MEGYIIAVLLLNILLNLRIKRKIERAYSRPKLDEGITDRFSGIRSETDVPALAEKTVSDESEKGDQKVHV